MESIGRTGIYAAIILVSGCGNDSSSGTITSSPPANGTHWRIEPSLKYDALCFVNTLTGDPRYLQYYSQDYLHFEPKLDSTTTAALASLHRQVKVEQGTILSASLSLLFSHAEGETIEDLIATVEDSRDLRESFESGPYYSDGAWMVYEAVRPDVLTIFRFLRDAGFADYWHEHAEPKALEAIATVGAELMDYDIVGEVERGLGQEMLNIFFVLDEENCLRPAYFSWG